RRAGGVLAARVADHAGEVADQELDLVPQLLEMAHLVDQHGVTEMQIGRGGVEAGLHTQGTAALEFLDQFGLDQQGVGAALDHVDRRLDFSQSISPKIPSRSGGQLCYTARKFSYAFKPCEPMNARKTRILADLPAHLLSRPRTWVATGVTGLS